MPLDLSKYTYEELIEIEKAIRTYKKDGCRSGEFISKGYVSKDTNDKLLSLMEKRFPVETYGGIEYEDGAASKQATSYFFKSKNSIFLLCDLALKNYHDIPIIARDGSKTNKVSLGNGPGGVIKSDPEKYVQMYNEIINIFMKYAEGENND